SNGNNGSDSSGNNSGDNGGSDSDSSDNGGGDTGPSVAVPGRVEAEDYVAYNDLTNGHEPGSLNQRNDDVDLQNTDDTDGGLNVGWISSGEWLEYRVSVAEAGEYKFFSRVAAQSNGKSMSFSISGQNVTGSMNVPNTFGWQNWRTIQSKTFTLQPGTYTVRANFGSNEFNFNYFEIVTADTELENQGPVSGGTIGDSIPTVDSPIQYTNSQGYRVTRFGGRVRDRHAREDFFHAYQHFVPNYFRNRTFGVEIIDRTPTGQSSITFNVTPEHDWVNTPNFRAFFTGVNTVAEYHQNMGLNRVHSRLWTKTITFSPDSNHRIDPGEMIEFEIGVFMQPDGGRTSYYSRAFLYHAGQGGLEPWAPTGRRGDSEPLPQKARTGGDLTISDDTSDEPDQMLMQLALNIAPEHAQPFVEGRRIHHSDLSTGKHSEGGMGNFGEMRNKVGPHFINSSCANCHEKNGKADHDTNDITNMVFKTDDPEFGSQIQTRRNGNIESEATINRTNNGFSFSGKQPNSFSARTAPSLIGVGLIDAISDETLMELADPNDKDGDGISGKARIVFDPVSGTERVGRFGWQAGVASLRYQIAAALNGDMGVTSSLFPELECGSSQITCNQVKDNRGIEMSDANMDRLEVYNALLGVPPRRNFNDGAVNRGETIFRDIGCNDCHVEQIVTGDNHKFPELNNQTIMPYSDFLLHDMGEGLAATFAEEGTLNTEWRTAPLWGISRSEDIHGDPQYLHDGRARNLHDAIMWHGGEAEESKQSYAGRSSSDQSALRQFLESL
ncbi:MAG: DUF5010 C-terminal domain-containing protein, partial [Pseudomonadales bacterium]|nr:DUF5010 C-terminal domain-containing protein [Pseudomonadales bacterium]